MKAFDEDQRTITQLLGGSEYYLVPKYQRAYTWEKDQIQALWEDVTDASLDGVTDFHFLGTLVLNKEDYARTNAQEIIDGQQRILSLTIFIAALRNLYYELESENKADGLHSSMISNPDINNKDQYKVRAGKDLDGYFEKTIQSRNRVESRPISDEQRLVRKNYNRFIDLIKNTDEWVSGTTKNKELLLDTLRDRIRNMKMLVVTVYSDVDAYTLFETLNARSLPLSEVDLIKNLIFKKLIGLETEDEIERKWNEISENISGDSVSVARNLQSFFKHYWWSQKEKIPQKKIFQSIKQDEGDYAYLVDNLRLESRLFGKLINPAETDWSEGSGVYGNLDHRDFKKVYKALKNIKILGVTQVYTVLLALLRTIARDDYPTFYKTSSVIDAFTWLEKFSFVFTLSDKYPSVVEKIYSEFAIEIHNIEKTSNKYKKANLNKLLQKLKQRVIDTYPAEDQFKATFVESIKYKTGGDNRGTLYVLEKLNYGDKTEQRLDEISIEHIYPQNPGPAWEQPSSELSKNVNSLGNLTLIDPKVNQAAGNRSLEAKVEEYKKSDIKMTKDLTTSLRKDMTWSDSQIIARTNTFAEKAWKLWQL